MNFDNRWHRDRARRTWHAPRLERRPRARRLTRAALILTALAGIAGGLGWAAYPFVPGEARAVADRSAGLSGRPVPIARFTLCHSGGGSNCVVDGDTFRMNGAKIRIADIDTPEISQPQCSREYDLGIKARDRLVALLNQGAFSAVAVGNRDEDRYGRKLRVLVRNGRSLGDQLVAEGLARTWTGRKESWC